MITYFDSAINTIFKKYGGNRRDVSLLKKEAEDYVNSILKKESEEHAKNVKLFGEEEASRIKKSKENAHGGEERHSLNEIYVPFAARKKKRSPSPLRWNKK